MTSGQGKREKGEVSEENKVVCEIRGQVALLSLNKPERRNALCTQLLVELEQHFQQLAADDDVRVIVLTGKGEGFCAGADLNDTKGFVSGERGIEDHYKPAYMEIVKIRKPVIACVRGGAAGGGMALAMCCDLMVMSENAYLKAVFSDLALVPDCGVNWMLPRAVGYQKAYEIAIEAQRIEARDALQMGLANRVVPEDELLEYTLEWAARLAKRAPLAMGYTKQLMRNSYTESFPDTFSAEGPVQDICLGSKDFMEGFSAFFEKREPVFKGK
jgi:2-(1,2-epoxy-1,2-dihydrophenyl)acetyl-CoA isomerase